MYSQASIEILRGRIKWRVPIGKHANILETELKAVELEKAYQDVHKLVTIENIHDTQPNKNISDSEFNTYLKRLNNICVNKVLEDVFDQNIAIDDTKNYDSLIQTKQRIFDAPLKLYMAVQVIQGIITSTRHNPEERSLKASYPHLKIELEGSKNEAGKVLSVGVSFLYKDAIGTVKKKLFPKEDKRIHVEIKDAS